MKKLISTFGLLMLMMVVTSFTTPNETGGKSSTGGLNFETGGKSSTGGLNVETGGKSSTGGLNFETGGRSSQNPGL